MESLPVAIVGCGEVALGFHAPAIEANPRTLLRVCCDTDLEKARRFAAKFGAPVATDQWESVLGMPEVKIVVVATPPEVTPHVAAAALRAGKAVLCEKPIATNLDDARALTRAVAETRGILQVGFIFRHNSALRRIAGWFKEGRIGTPAVLRLGAYDEVWMDDVPGHNQRLMGFLKTASPLFMMGAHFADLVSWMIPARPLRATGAAARTRAELPAPNHWMGLLSCADGSLAKLEVGWLHPLPRSERQALFYPAAREDEWEFFGSRAVVRYNLQTGKLRYADGDESFEEQYPPQEFNFDRQLECLLRAIDGVAPPEPDVWAGFRSLAIAALLQEAARNGQSLTFDWDRMMEGAGLPAA